MAILRYIVEVPDDMNPEECCQLGAPAALLLSRAFNTNLERDASPGPLTFFLQQRPKPRLVRDNVA